MKRTTFIVAGSCLIAGAIWWSAARPPRPTVSKADPVRSARQAVDTMYAAEPKKAEAGYKDFIREHEASPDPKVQDEVAAARLRVAYLAAREKDFSKARTTFMEAEAKYKGTGSMGSDFGGLKDQAAYQAAVCLMADGKKKEAKAAFIDFLKEYKLSPLVHAAHRRLEMLDPKGQDEFDGLLQAAVTAQDTHIRFETSVCGPKVIAYLLEKLGKPKKDYKELAKLCGTTNSGTTLDGMRKGLKACGLTSVGYELNREDFLKLKAPAIILKGDHYVALIEITETHVVVYDPVKGGEDKFPVPPAEKANFSIAVLTLEPLALEAQ